MAIAQYGVLGPQVGRIRNFVFYMLKGKPVCRSIGKYVDNPSTDQEHNRNGMSVTMRFVQALHQIINLGFGVEARGTVRSAFNLAISHNKKHALKGKGDNIKVDYTKALISRGDLPGTADVAISKAKDGLLVKWDNSINNGAKGSDILMIALYYPGSKGADLHINKACREDGELFVTIPKRRQDEPVEAFMFFKSVDGERVSDSQYLGNMNGKVMNAEEKEQYALALVALAKAQSSFAKQQQKFEETGKKTRGYRDLDKECQVWRDRMFQLSGRPG